ncbi:MAG TPA: hypothetical protein P5526_20625 [Anaerolineae bacterium]|nr:hypothetical protein [Anaerolineae bacterium]MCB0177218.1 hypothetical protein [Anaerolineae bacterium]MCB0224437.1 hypothetical protein [Anaerolineae bacterium]MCB9103739.1 hypothetical protein [Anaerolineales bacterium]HRV94576.1 hypothetical protein [Anaerolineae bacterium]
MAWVIFWAVIAGVTGLLALFLIAYLVRSTLKTLPPEKLEKWGQIKSSMRLWGVLGTIFGIIGATLMMKFTGISGNEAAYWILFGAVVGTIWGVLWGVVWALTSR